MAKRPTARSVCGGAALCPQVASGFAKHCVGVPMVKRPPSSTTIPQPVRSVPAQLRWGSGWHVEATQASPPAQRRPQAPQ